MRTQRQPSDAFLRAWRHVLSAAREATALGSTRLPTTRELASACEVAPGTMRRAVGTLVNQGVLAASPRSGIQVVGEIPALTSPETLAPHALTPNPQEQPDAGLMQDILQLRYPPGSRLPSSKQLCYRYGIAPQTLRKRLARLADQDMIERAGRGYRVPQLPQARGWGTILVVAPIPDRAGLETQSPRSSQFWRELEYACRRSATRLRVCAADEIMRGPPEGLAGEGAALGSIVLTTSLPETDVPVLVRHLAAGGRPCAVVDEVNEVRVRQWAYRCAAIRQARFFALASTPLAGEHVGRFLLRLGHRRIAFFNLLADDQTMLLRLFGVRSAFAAAGYEDSVVRFASDDIREAVDTTEALDRHPVYGPSMQHMGDLLNRVQQHSRMPEHVGMRPDIGRFVVTRHFLYEQLVPLFTAALTDHTITAWVGATDPVALMAQAFLEQHRRTPPPISVVGFDNSLLAFANGLSSYDFNIPALVNHLMTHILGPRRRGMRAARGQVTEVPGFVMARASTDAAPG